MGPAQPVTSNVVPFAFEAPFSFDSDRSAACGWYGIISVGNKNLTIFFAVFMLFHVCICNIFENTLISYHPNNL
jgi:hypothetical protein